MKDVILYDKFKNRKEQMLEDTPDEFNMMQDDNGLSYNIKYTLQFYDKKKRAVYVEKSRTYINSEILKEIK